MPNIPYDGTMDESPVDVAARIAKVLAAKYPNQSPSEVLAALPYSERQAWIGSLTSLELSALEYDWRNFWARPNQR